MTEKVVTTIEKRDHKKYIVYAADGHWGLERLIQEFEVMRMQQSKLMMSESSGRDALKQSEKARDELERKLLEATIRLDEARKALKRVTVRRVRLYKSVDGEPPGFEEE